MARSHALALALAACSAPTRPPLTASAPARSAHVAPPARVLAGNSFYRVDTGPVRCAVGSPCDVRIRLTALDGYKVNEEYPFKLVAEPSADLAVDGSGTFSVLERTRGELVVSVRATRAGSHELAGTFKLSVCTDEHCEIQQPRIALAIDAHAP